MRIFSVLFFAVLTGNAMAQEESATTPEIAIRLPLGESAALGEVTVEFKEVLEDSRCPKDVTCVWAGLAKVSLKLQNKEAAYEKALIVGKKGKNVVLSEGGYTYLAQMLNPYPTTTNIGTPGYVLLITKRKDSL